MKRTILMITVIAAAIMELIDTSIVNVALSYMSGNLGAIRKAWEAELLYRVGYSIHGVLSFMRSGDQYMDFCRPYYRAYAWGFYNRALFLALDLLYQCSDRDNGSGDL